MLGAIKNLFTSEKCAMCGEVTREGVTGFDNKFRCYTCKRIDDERKLNVQTSQEKIIKEVLPQQIEKTQQEKQKTLIENPLLDKTQNEALNFFSNVYGLEDVKEDVYLGMTAEAIKTRTLLVGPPASAKSLIAMTVAKKMKDIIYFDAANLSGAGLIETLYQNQNAKGLVIDEIDKLNKKDMACLLGLFANGQITKTLKGKRISFTMDVNVLATSNSTEKLSKPILSRFAKTILAEYTDEEFKKICEFCLKEYLPIETTQYIAEALLKHNKRDVRTAMNLAGRIRKHHDREDVLRIVETRLKYDSEEVVNFN